MFISIIFLILFKTINAQDSLFTLLKTATHDTTRIKLFLDIGDVYENEKPDTAIFFYQKALNLAERATQNLTGFKNLSGLEARFLSLQATSLRYIGIIHKSKGDYDKAIDCYFKSLKISEELGNKKGMSASYNNTGNIHLYKGDYDKAIEFYFKSLKIDEELGDKKGMANLYNNIGLIHENKGDYDKAIDFYFKSLKICEELGDKNGISGSYNNIGNIHYYKGDYDKAIDFYFKSLKIFEELGDKNGMANSYICIGIIHTYKGDYDKAVDFYFKSLKIYEELGDKNGMSASYNNIGIIHKNKGDYDKAIDFYFKSLKIYEELGYKNGMSASYNNIGGIHYYKGYSQLDKEIQRDEYDLAIEFFFKSLKIFKELGDKNGMATSYNNIGGLYLKQGKPEEAKKQQLQALYIALEIGAKEQMYYAYRSLAQCDSALGNFRGAYEYHKLYSQIHDSVFSKESSDKIAEMGAKYEAEKRELTIQKLEKEKLLQNETLARKEAESRKQQILLFSFLAGFIIILVFSVFLYRLFVQKKMANVILEQQKEEISAQRDEIETQRDLVTEQKEHIEEIHKEVTDSINYAKRIQEAMLPQLSSKPQDLSPKPQDLESEKLRSSEMFIAKEINNNIVATTNVHQSDNVPCDKDLSPKLQAPNLKPPNLEFETWNLEFETFILFRPKDVVSGDFYWFSQVNDYQIYAVADCTGHGVPGAFMSMLGISFLNEIVRKKEITQASHVLDQLRVSVIDALRQTGESGTQKDGMDMSLVVIKSQDSNSKFQVQSSKEEEKITNEEQRISNDEISYNVQWAGANNPLWVVRSSENLTGFENLLGLEEVKPDKMPIAIYEKMNKFTNHEITLCSGDIIYLMSDGYEDQFGGSKGKKFLSKNLKELIIANCLLTMEEQKLVLEKTLVEWIGNGEQIDDITLMGIRI